MGVNIYPGEATRDGSQEGHDIIRRANGFAQVLPRDKREVVLVLRNIFNQVCGMTGDGVNDAPALSAAQCGIAVDDATDAAKNAAAIILTSPGLSAIYSAVVESRRIFRKLKAYVTYRFAATIQFVCVLTLLIYISNCSINATYIIILALFNDLTMLPIAYDRQQASAFPENPDVVKMLTMSGALGVTETIFTMIFAYGCDKSGIFEGSYPIESCPKSTQAAIWLQMFISAELLIFVTRAPKLIIFSLPPSIALFCSVLGGCLIASLMAGLSKYFGGLQVADIVLIWCFDLIGFGILDFLKVGILAFFNEQTEVLPDQVETGSVSDKPAKNHKKDIEHGHDMPPVQQGEEFTRASMSANRLTEWAIQNNERLSTMEGYTRPSQAGHAKPRMSSANMVTPDTIKQARESFAGRLSVSHAVPASSGAELRPSFIGGSIRPNVPGNRSKY